LIPNGNASENLSFHPNWVGDHCKCGEGDLEIAAFCQTCQEGLCDECVKAHQVESPNKHFHNCHLFWPLFLSRGSLPQETIQSNTTYLAMLHLEVQQRLSLQNVQER